MSDPKHQKVDIQMMPPSNAVRLATVVSDPQLIDDTPVGAYKAALVAWSVTGCVWSRGPRLPAITLAEAHLVRAFVLGNNPGDGSGAHYDVIIEDGLSGPTVLVGLRNSADTTGAPWRSIRLDAWTSSVAGSHLVTLSPWFPYSVELARDPGVSKSTGAASFLSGACASAACATPSPSLTLTQYNATQFMKAACDAAAAPGVDPVVGAFLRSASALEATLQSAEAAMAAAKTGPPAIAAASAKSDISKAPAAPADAASILASPVAPGPTGPIPPAVQPTPPTVALASGSPPTVATGEAAPTGPETKPAASGLCNIS